MHHRSIILLLSLSCPVFASCQAYDATLLDKPLEDDGAYAADDPDAFAGSAAAARASAFPEDAAVAEILGCAVAVGGGGTCTVSCAEACNGEDDDCDRMIDEEVECVLDNATAACARGECLIAKCDEGFRDCDGQADNGCEVADDDVANCGLCGTQCILPNAVAACIDGDCVAVGCLPGFADCDDNPLDCETAATTLDNCGACGQSCEIAAGSATCGTGSCAVAQCAVGRGDCNGYALDGCESTLSDSVDCGACGAACDLAGSVADCASGTCLAVACEDGYEDCDGDPANGCESLTSPEHCGGCWRGCGGELPRAASAVCEAGQCAVECQAGYADCDGDPSDGCETSLSSVYNCGGCGVGCELANALETCLSGSCQLLRCRIGWGDCDGDAGNGCETRLDSDSACGSCGRDCTATANPVCSGGVCSPVVCEAGTADCNQDGLPCEVQLADDDDNCGQCGQVCRFETASPHASDLSCSGGECVPICDPLWADCNGDFSDGCETPLDTLDDCGACGARCSVANGSATCASGVCELQACATDFADCDGDGRSCETRLGTASACQGCGMACRLPNAQAACGGLPGNHACVISACSSPQYADCDGRADNGCEVNLSSDAAHCGGCGDSCGGGANAASGRCVGGSCDYSCASGFGDCTAAPGCETMLVTNDDCGACGVRCQRANASSSCATGSCVLTACNPGFADCDGNPGNGCEALNTSANCGACGTPCAVDNGSGSCATGACAVSTCAAGWDDCDLEPDNGCEHDVRPPSAGGLGPCLPDTDCGVAVHDGRQYFACEVPRTWDDAQLHCRQQQRGDLVHIDDAAENAFVLSLLGADAWIDSSALSGDGATGAPPTCPTLKQIDGIWTGRSCAALQPFVCEIQPATVGVAAAAEPDAAP